MNGTAGGLFSAPPPPFFMISDKNGGARYSSRGPGMKMTPLLERQLLKAESGIELTGDITFQLSSAAQSSGKKSNSELDSATFQGCPLTSIISHLLASVFSYLK